MAGGWGHVTEAGFLRPGPVILDMLDTGGDVVETVEQMFGMIWSLAYAVADMKHADPAPQEVYAEVSWALLNYRDGIDMGGRV